MYRRTLLATTVAVAAAGCVDATAGRSGDDRPAGGGSDAGPTESSGPDASGVTVADNPAPEEVTITETEAASAGEASVEFASDAVHVEGTVLGETGCYGVEIVNARTTDDGGFQVVVAAVDDPEPETLCTQALTRVGYEVDATFADGVPASVSVVHDDADGHGTVVADAAMDDE